MGAVAEGESLAGKLVKITRPGSRYGLIGMAMERTGEKQNTYCVELPRSRAQLFFNEDELEEVKEMPCPDCFKDGVRKYLSKPVHTPDGWRQECPVHGTLFLWGWSNFPSNLSLH